MSQEDGGKGPLNDPQDPRSGLCYHFHFMYVEAVAQRGWSSGHRSPSWAEMAHLHDSAVPFTGLGCYPA